MTAPRGAGPLFSFPLGCSASQGEDGEAAGLIDPLEAIGRSHFELGLGGGNALAARRAFAAAARTAEHFERPAHRKLTGRELRVTRRRRIGNILVVSEAVPHPQRGEPSCGHGLRALPPARSSSDATYRI
jgi:hypothetical protein